MKDFMIERQPKTKMVLNLGTRSRSHVCRNATFDQTLHMFYMNSYQF